MSCHTYVLLVLKLDVPVICRDFTVSNCIVVGSLIFSVFCFHLTDHKSTAETGHELMRPFLHEFLMSAYEDYDIVIWCEYRESLGRHRGENNQGPAGLGP